MGLIGLKKLGELRLGHHCNGELGLGELDALLGLEHTELGELGDRSEFKGSGLCGEFEMIPRGITRFT